MADNIKLYDVNDGLRGRGGGPYADIEERKAAEIRRAEIEGRRPDLENPGAVAGTVLVTASQLLAANGVNIASTGDNKTAEDQAMVEAIAATETSTIQAVAEVPVEEEETPEEPPAEPGEGEPEPVPQEESADPFAGTPAE